MKYRDLLMDRRWQRKRLEAMNAAGWLCQQCSSNDNSVPLHVHHMAYVYGRAPWEYRLNELAVLCDPCHAMEHGKRESDPELTVLYQAMAEAHRVKDWDRMKLFADEAMKLLELGFYYKGLL